MTKSVSSLQTSPSAGAIEANVTLASEPQLGLELKMEYKNLI